jgi:outer membrane protein OmpA-like peptidoglycan-associated protein
MSRWSDRSPRLVLALGVIWLVALLLADFSPEAVAAPDPEAPVEAIDAPVADIEFSTTDLKREVRTDESADRVRVTLDATVLFGKDSAAIRPGAARRLAEVASTLASRPAGRVRIVGYTDDLGSADHGLDLSRRRAGAVAVVLRRDLRAFSYPFAVVGRGEADPVVPNTSEANRKRNRRVVVTYQRR